MSIKTKKKLQKAASIATTGATILWLSGVSMLLPAVAATYADGTLLKGSAPTIWVVNNNLKVEIRSADVFNNSGYDWNAIQTVSDSALNAVPTADLIKTATNPDVYRIEKNFTRKLASIEIFNSYNLDWGKIATVSQPAMDSFSYAPIYQHGANLYWRDASNVLHLFPTMELFTGNGYQTRDLIVVNDMEYGSFAVGENISSAPETPVVAGTLTVALAADTPVAGSLAGDLQSITGSYYGFGATDLAHFIFTNGSDADVKVTGLKVKRLGVSGDSTITNLYIFDGLNRLTDEATFSSGVANFNDAAGIFTVPANSSKTISVRGEYYNTTSISGQTIGVSLDAAASVVSDASFVGGSYPINGNLMTVIESANLGTADLSSVTQPSTSPEAQNDFTVWSNTLAVTSQDLNLELLRFTQIGSIGVNDFTNIKLKINNVEVATGELVAGKTGQDLIFDLSSNPYKILKGNTITIAVVGDLVGGTSKTLHFSIDKAADILLKDLGYGNYTRVAGTFPSRPTSASTVSTGTITMTKQVGSAVGNVTSGQTNVSLAKFDVKANGEEIKINTLKVQAYMAATTTTTTHIRNVALYLDGVQVGNTANLAVTAGASDTATYTSYSIYQKIPAGTTKTLEVKGDIYTCGSSACSSNVATADDTLVIKVIGSASEENAQGMTSLVTTIDAPGSTVTANTLTVGTGSLTLAKNTAYTNQTVASGGNIKIGSYNLQANSYDAVNITGFTVAYYGSDSIATTKWANMYLVYGGTETSAKGTISTSNTFSVNTSLAASQSIQIDVYATLDASVSSGGASTTLAVTATRAVDGQSANANAVTGQDISVSSASRLVSIDNVIPSALVVGGATGVEVMNVNFKSLNAPSTIDQMRLRYATGTNDTDVDAIINCKVNYPTESGTAETAYMPFVYDGSAWYYATFTGMNMYLPANLDKTVKVYCNFNNVGTGYADTGDDPAVRLYDYRVTSGGTQSTEVDGTDYGTASSITSQTFDLRKSKPVVTNNTLSSTYLTAGTGITIAKFTITPDAAGSIGWNRLVFQYASSTNVDLTSGASYIKLYNENTSQEVTASSTIGTVIDYDNKDITFTAATEQIIGSATTYTLRADIGGTLDTGDYLSLYVKNRNSATTTPDLRTAYTGASNDDSFVWSDRSNTSHTLSTADWANDQLVKYIGSGYSWTLTR